MKKPIAMLGAIAACAAFAAALGLGMARAVNGGAAPHAAQFANQADAAPNATAALTAALPNVAIASPGAGADGAGAAHRLAPHPTQPNPSSAAAAAAQTTIDYDDDDDGLIDVRTLAQLNAIRYDLNGNGNPDRASDASSYAAAFPNRDSAAATRMGCPETSMPADATADCAGYELRADLDFDTDGDGDVDSNDAGSYANWNPIGSAASKYTAEFKGNNRTISNLTITSGSGKLRLGLFSSLSPSGVISGVGMQDANIDINAALSASRVAALAGCNRYQFGTCPHSSHAGALVGYNEGAVRSSYSTGRVNFGTGGGGGVFGGLAGMVENGGSVEACWSSARVHANGNLASVGGLVGQIGFSGSRHGSVTASYATGRATVQGATTRASGFVGYIATAGSRIAASYSTGSVTARGRGAWGHSFATKAFVVSYAVATSNSYWDTTSSGRSDDGNSIPPEGVTAANMKAPTDYSGIYASWNVNVDGVTGNDDPWDFGTSSHYPRLKFDDMNLMAQLRDYDLDDDGLADIYTLDQLNAARWDLDGSGAHDSGVSGANRKRFKQAWLNADASLGCSDTADVGTAPGPCVGYELMNDLDFDTDGDGDVDANDSPSYTNWSPIGTQSAPYTSRFEGNQKVVRSMRINSGLSRVGLFGQSSGTITRLGVEGASVRATSTTENFVGVLVGRNQGTVRSSWATGSITRGAGSSSIRVGGLVGNNTSPSGGAATIAASWAGVSVSLAPSGAYAGGLVGTVNSGTITASYAKGAVKTTGGSAFSGGLVGWLNTGASVDSSYAVGAVTASGSGGTAGGLAASGSGAVTASYWDAGTTGVADDADGSSPEGVGTSDLQSITSYTGVFVDWNANVDGQTGADNPWNFGATMQYPRLQFGFDARGQVSQGSLAMGTPGTNGDNPVVGQTASVCLVAGPNQRAARAGNPSLPSRWVWSHSDDGVTWTNIAEDGGATYEYTPTSGASGVVGKYLRACVALNSSLTSVHGADEACAGPFAKVQASN